MFLDSRRATAVYQIKPKKPYLLELWLNKKRMLRRGTYKGLIKKRMRRMRHIQGLNLKTAAAHLRTAGKKHYARPKICLKYRRPRYITHMGKKYHVPP